MDIHRLWDICKVVSESKKRGQVVQHFLPMQSVQGSGSGYTASLQYQRWEAGESKVEITTINMLIWKKRYRASKRTDDQHGSHRLIIRPERRHGEALAQWQAMLASSCFSVPNAFTLQPRLIISGNIHHMPSFLKIYIVCLQLRWVWHLTEDGCILASGTITK